ncbi:undecaprenyl-diphosphatase [Neobacillus sp. PS2-9]|uniref:undecaprenyl-diphosphatase n=1 Tax=Neobacillus sp. PS2-9 TaxID=3070676 RepID=UPI0027DFF378|nr:undecaprenyl-diphosphatase [Neobacillus sp. PS2-9]WML56629.1 undecaprenyl-diphosphatase [Neobacillus sp. PS2-9]
MLSQLDYSIFQSINHLAVNDKFLNPLMEFLAERAEYLFFAGILFYWFFQKSKNRRMIVEASFAACIALGLNMLIGMFFYRDRPFVAHHVNWLIPHVKNASFPSDHATAAFVIATGIWIWRKRDGWVWLILAAGIALSRVWTGVHYPLDVIAGMIIGTSCALTINYLAKRWVKFNKLMMFLIRIYHNFESLIVNRLNLVKKS